MSTVWAALSAFAVGVGSVLPLVNAEAYQAATAPGLDAASLGAAVVALAVGHTTGKSLMFLASRRGLRFVSGRRLTAARVRSTGPASPAPVSTGLASPGPATPHRAGRRLRAWVTRACAAQLRFLGRPRLGPVVVLSSAAVGIPPLLAVTTAAGASTIRLPTFFLACLTGRTARFAAIAAGATAVLG